MQTSGTEAEVIDFPAPSQASHAREAPARGAGLRLIAERARRVHFIDAETVDYLEAEGNYVTLHVGADRYLTRQTLTELARLLEPVEFLRIERGLVVNLRQVSFVERLERGTYAFELKRGHRLVSSRERAGSITRLLRGACLPVPYP
jgi:two-component system LytT family response regulator